MRGKETVFVERPSAAIFTAGEQEFPGVFFLCCHIKLSLAHSSDF